jgi:P-type conjugative transfer protein TrbJ
MSTTSSMLSLFPWRPRSSLARAAAAGLLVAAAWSGVVAPPQAATAQQVVFDPKNHLENALQAARQLEGLANDATQLANEARMLTQSPWKKAAEISATVRAIDELAREAKGIASDVGRLEQQFQNLYAGDLSGKNLGELARSGEQRVRIARKTAEDVARVAAEVQALSRGRSARVSGALTASETAVGQTAAIQSSTQLLGVLAEDLGALRTVMAAQSRLLAEATARDAAERESAAEARKRLWGRSTATKVAPPRFDPLSRARN